MTGGTDEAHTLVFAEAHAAGSAATFVRSGRWAGGGFDAQGTLWPARIETLSPGVVAGFIGNPQGTLDALRIVTVPSVSYVGSGHSSGTPPFDLSVPGGAPGAGGTTVLLRVDAFGSWAPQCMIYISGGLLQQPVSLPPAMFAVGSLLHLDLDLLALVEAVPLAGGVGVVSYNVQFALQSFAGRPLYAQAALEDGLGVLHVSSAVQVVLN